MQTFMPLEFHRSRDEMAVRWSTNPLLMLRWATYALLGRHGHGSLVECRRRATHWQPQLSLKRLSARVQPVEAAAC
jgi:hypothetical protein